MSATLRAAAPNDLRALAKFLVHVYKFEPSDFHADPQLLEWKYLCPRSSWSSSRSYLLERHGELVAHAGLCPVAFRLPAWHIVNSLPTINCPTNPRSPTAALRLSPQ